MVLHDDATRDGIFEAIFALGVNFLLQGQYEKALTIFDGLMALYPEHALVAVAYGESLMMSGQIEQAYIHFSGMLKKFLPDGKMLLGAARAGVLLGRHDEVKKFLFPLIEGQAEATSSERNTARSMFLAISSEAKNRH